jgi:flagellum-specific ATP synthase
MSALLHATAAIGHADLHRRRGRVTDLIGLIVEATGLEAEVGEVCLVRTGRQVDGPVGPALLGGVLDGLGNPIDGGPPLDGVPRAAITASPPSPMERPRITERVSLGVRSLDGLVPCGRGQRLGIFAGSGVGKSSLLGMIAAGTSADINVICLVGERGREVREFIDRDLGDALSRSVVVVATSDQPALVRIKAALTATT